MERAVEKLRRDVRALMEYCFEKRSKVSGGARVAQEYRMSQLGLHPEHGTMFGKGHLLSVKLHLDAIRVSRMT